MPTREITLNSAPTINLPNLFPPESEPVPPTQPDSLPAAPPPEPDELVVEGADQENVGYAPHVESYSHSAAEEAEAAQVMPALESDAAGRPECGDTRDINGSTAGSK